MYKKVSKLFALALAYATLNSLFSAHSSKDDDRKKTEFVYEEFPLERNGISLHLDRVKKKESNLDRNILLIHGVTYSSHEFDIDYKDYSLVRFLAEKGYCVWRLDIAGFGRSQSVKDGFMPDTAYAAENIGAAVKKIKEISGQKKIDLLGWSWGTVTTSRYIIDNSEDIRKLILYAPIMSGLGEEKINEAFHLNSWQHAADDFQKDENGDFDYDIIDPLLLELWCSSCWRYDGQFSPNGGRRDICVDKGKQLIDPDKIAVKTLVICGDRDPYVNYELVGDVLHYLPEGSKLEVIKGGSHALIVEKPYYHTFQNILISFLNEQE